MITSCVLLVAIAVGANGQAYLPVAKEHFLTDSLLREVVDRMGRDLAESYLDSNQLTVGEDPPYYQDSPHPSLRDREYLQHSSLWGHQYMTGDQ
ncbi:Neuroendocrine protein 7B2 [Homalodisca vitripennis]|nr:Neuroendocrine protein 7B2 [Homalodisca vitripennis]